MTFSLHSGDPKVFCKQIIYCCILLLVVGYVIFSIRTSFRVKSLIYRHSENTFCNPSQRNIVDGHFRLDNDYIIDNMDMNSSYQTFKKYVMDRQWTCCYIESYRQDDGNNDTICFDALNFGNSECFIVTFGLKPGLKFEKEFRKGYTCYVYLFDHRVITKTTYIPKYITFFNWGLVGRDTIGDNMTTLSGIYRMMNLECNLIDLLKLNLEAWDWESLSLMIEMRELERVKQLYLEVQISNQAQCEGDKRLTELEPETTSLKTMLKILRRLYEQGFRIVWTESMDFHLNCSSVLSLSLINSKLFGNPG